MRSILKPCLLALSIPFALALAGCAPGFSGTWDCKIDSTTTYTQPPNADDYDGSGDYTLSISEGASGVVETRTEGSVGPPCALHFSVEADGMTAKLADGQTCKNSIGNTVAYSNGKSTLETDTLTGSFAFTVTGKTAAGADLAGSGQGDYTCTRAQQ